MDRGGTTPAAQLIVVASESTRFPDLMVIALMATGGAAPARRSKATPPLTPGAAECEKIWHRSFPRVARNMSFENEWPIAR